MYACIDYLQKKVQSEFEYKNIVYYNNSNSSIQEF